MNEFTLWNIAQRPHWTKLKEYAGEEIQQMLAGKKQIEALEEDIAYWEFLCPGLHFEEATQ